MAIYKNLRDDFANDDGTLADYNTSAEVAIDKRKHADIRTFGGIIETLPWKAWDMKFWNNEHFTGMTMEELESRVVVNSNENWTVDADVTVGTDSAFRYMDTLRVTLDDGVLETITSVHDDDLLTDFTDQDYAIELALPGFPAQSAAARLDLNNSFIDFSSDPSFAFDDTDSIPFSASTNSLTAGGDTYFRMLRTSLVKSDPSDIKAIRLRLLSSSAPATVPTLASGGAGALTGAFDYKVTFVVSGVESLPSVASAPITVSSEQVDLTNIPLGPTGTTARKIYRRAATQPIFPDEALFPDELTYPSTATASFTYALVDTIADNTTTVFTDNDTTLGAAPPTTSTVGDMTFRAAAMRLVPITPIFEEIDTNTKYERLVRSVPRTGAPEPGTTFGMMYFDETRPADTTMYVRFNSGHNPTGNDNGLVLDFRHSSADNDSVRVKLLARDTQSRLRIYNVDNNVETEVFSTGTNTNILTESTNYYLVVSLTSTTINATIYNSDGFYLGSQVYTTGNQTVTLNRRGKLGYSFEPYNYDFTLDWIGALRATFARFESKSFDSFTPVIGASLVAKSSDTIDALSGTMIASGDGTPSVDTIGNPSPSTKIVRTGTLWYGGIEQDIVSALGNPQLVRITGDLYPQTQLRGEYRVVLLDQYDTVVYISTIENLLVNRWNHFELQIAANLTPASLKLLVHQTGFFADTFFIDNLKLEHTSVLWEASANGGTNWQPFLTAVNDPHTGLKFANRGTALRIRAEAHSDEAWIHGYQLIPHYAYPGH